MEKITAVITTYNRKFDVLERAILSVLNQTYPLVELIVVNDTPKESPLYHEISEKIKKYKGQLEYYAYGSNNGACYARNYGASYGKGNYIAFLDDDDEWLPTKLAKQITEINKSKSVMVTCYQNTIVVDSKKISLETIKYALRRPPKNIELQTLLFNNIVGGCSRPLILKSAFDKVGGFDLEIPASQDTDLWIRLVLIGNVTTVKEKLMNYYINKKDQISYSPRKRIEANLLLIDKYKDLAVDSELFIKNKYLTISYSYYLLSDATNGNKYYKLFRDKKGMNLSTVIKLLRVIKLRRKL